MDMQIVYLISFISKSATAGPPVFRTIGPSGRGPFVVAAVDLDAPTPQNPTVAQIRHFLGGDFFLQTPREPHLLTNNTPAISQFRQPTPPAGSDPHRYSPILLGLGLLYWSIYKQIRFLIIQAIEGLWDSDPCHSEHFDCPVQHQLICFCSGTGRTTWRNIYAGRPWPTRHCLITNLALFFVILFQLQLNHAVYSQDHYLVRFQFVFGAG